MAEVCILNWNGLPSQVKVSAGGKEVSELLPPRFQEAIDREAMRRGEFGTDAYLDGWAWSEAEEVPGTAEEALRRVVERLLAEGPS